MFVDALTVLARFLLVTPPDYAVFAHVVVFLSTQPVWEREHRSTFGIKDKLPFQTTFKTFLVNVRRLCANEYVAVVGLFVVSQLFCCVASLLSCPFIPVVSSPPPSHLFGSTVSRLFRSYFAVLFLLAFCLFLSYVFFRIPCCPLFVARFLSTSVQCVSPFYLDPARVIPQFILVRVQTAAFVVSGCPIAAIPFWSFLFRVLSFLAVPSPLSFLILLVLFLHAAG